MPNHRRQARPGEPPVVSTADFSTNRRGGHGHPTVPVPTDAARRRASHGHSLPPIASHFTTPRGSAEPQISDHTQHQGLTAGKAWQHLAFGLSKITRASIHIIFSSAQVAWRCAPLLPQLRGSTLLDYCGPINNNYDLQLSLLHLSPFFYSPKQSEFTRLTNSSPSHYSY